jgi:hypothetical protein
MRGVALEEEGKKRKRRRAKIHRDRSNLFDPSLPFFLIDLVFLVNFK